MLAGGCAVFIERVNEPPLTCISISNHPMCSL